MGDGFIKAYPCGVFPPDVSSLNFGGGSVSNLVNTRVATDGTVCFMTSFGPTVDIIVDVAGIFSAAPGPVPLSR